MTVELPHTGLTVPHDRITLDGPGIIALDGQPVGQIVIDTDDHCEVFEPLNDEAPLSVGDFFDYAAACRTPVGDPIDFEDIFLWLRAEYATGRALQRAADAGETVAQAMEPHGDGYLPGETIRVAHDEEREHVAYRADHAGCPAGTWWRIYDGNQWVELAPISATC